MPPAMRSHSAVRCGSDPRVEMPILSSPGRFFASAISSGSVSTPSVGARADHHRMRADKADRHEVARHVERQLRQHLRQREEVRRHRNVERVAVRRRRAGGAHGDGAAGAGPVLDHHLLAPELAEMLGDDAGDHVGPGAGGDRDDHLHRTARIVLRAAPAQASAAASSSARQQRASAVMAVSPSFISLSTSWPSSP